MEEIARIIGCRRTMPALMSGKTGVRYAGAAGRNVRVDSAPEGDSDAHGTMLDWIPAPYRGVWSRTHAH